MLSNSNTVNDGCLVGVMANLEPFWGWDFSSGDRGVLDKL